MSDDKNVTPDNVAGICNDNVHKGIQDSIVDDDNVSTTDNKEENSRNHISGDEEENANMFVTQDEIKEKLLNLSSSLSSESICGRDDSDGIDAGHLGDSGEDPHGSAPGDERSTIATINTVRVKEESTIPDIIIVANKKEKFFGVQ
eukprot:9021729-Ditylum_brightwellii.AAC.1